MALIALSTHAGRRSRRLRRLAGLCTMVIAIIGTVFEGTDGATASAPLTLLNQGDGRSTASDQIVSSGRTLPPDLCPPTSSASSTAAYKSFRTSPGGTEIPIYLDEYNPNVPPG